MFSPVCCFCSLLAWAGGPGVCSRSPCAGEALTIALKPEKSHRTETASSLRSARSFLPAFGAACVKFSCEKDPLQVASDVTKLMSYRIAKWWPSAETSAATTSFYA